MAVHPNAQRIANDVAYEVESFFQSLQRLERHLGADAVDDNQRLENVLLHARVIYDFLFVAPRNKHPDVSALHFFDNTGQWSGNPNTLCPYLTQRRERLNRSVPHLSYDRIAFESNKAWDLHTVATEIKNAWEFFLKQLAPARRQWFAPSTPPRTNQYQPPANLCAKSESQITHIQPIRPY